MPTTRSQANSDQHGQAATNVAAENTPVVNDTSPSIRASTAYSTVLPNDPEAEERARAARIAAEEYQAFLKKFAGSATSSTSALGSQQPGSSAGGSSKP